MLHPEHPAKYTERVAVLAFDRNRANESRSLRSHDNGDTCKDPALDILLLGLHLKAGAEDVSGTTLSSHVDRAVVDGDGLLVDARDRSDMDDGKDRMELLELHVDKITLFLAAAHFPTGTFKEETVDVGTLGSEVREVFSSE